MTPSVRNLVDTMINTAEDIASFECGKPDDETMRRLQRLSKALQEQLEPVVGLEMARRTIDGFIATVIGQKRERETLAAMKLL